jgi:Putative beta-barrel porin-2, OmpL-like. bbp2
MKCNQWTLALAALGLVSLASVARADDKPTALMTALSSTTLSGYVDTSMQWNLGDGNANTPAYGFNSPSKTDGFNLNVVDLNLEKDADPADGWGAGYRVELWMGPDATALATSSSGTTADFAVKNAYVDLKAPVGNGLDAKIGVWDTPIGYEVADSPNNPNFTRSYGFSIEPTTHTGVLLGYTVSDMISLSAGIADSFGPGINARSVDVSGNTRESYKTYMAAATFTASTNWGWVGGSTISACIINGYNPGVLNTAPNGRDQTSYYVGSTLNTPLTALKLGASFDYVQIRNQDLNGQAGSYQEVAGLFATFQVTEKMSVNGRAEYLQQSKNISGDYAFNGALPSKAIEATVTVQYDLWKNVLSRVEARWDHQAGEAAAGSDGAAAFGGLSNGGPGGTLHNSYELLANVVYKF